MYTNTHTQPSHDTLCTHAAANNNSKASTKHKHSLLIAPTISYSLRIRYKFILIRNDINSHKLKTNWERISRFPRSVLQTGHEGYFLRQWVFKQCFRGSATEEVLTASTTVEATSFAEQILEAKFPKMRHGEFGELSWVPTTSNLAQRLFSQAKYFLNQNRKNMLPMHLECQLFLMISEQFRDVN